MATEAADKNIVDAPAIDDPETTTANTAPQDDSSKPASVKDTASDGPATPNPEPSDLGIPSTEGSVNGGSDSEALKAKGDGHVRTSSTAKKPISFKTVSVNKKFLAAKSATGTTAAKNGDKGAGASASPTPSSSTLVSKPRLVAKSGSGLLSSSSRLSSSGAGGSSGGAPDGNAVWNKNRPAPVPEVKRVTDEELAEKYGIHLATRLHSDGADKQANWADIDDDDDDWAPESIEWADGTKVTMPTQTDSPVPAPAKPVPQATAPPPPPPAVVTAARTEKPASPGPSMTSSMKLGGGRGLVLKAGASEKPTLVAKPPAPSVVKSPWAPLPPVDKASPVVTELPQHHQQQPPRFINRNPHGFEGMPRAPATEIAADDFSRGWREHDSGASRELYNSQSGRYEPVNDARRGSRNDMHSRAPALLQRHHEMQGPAEPSSAFQTHREHVPEALYGRRRTSSNVSGGSGLFGRRLSRGQDSYAPHDMPEARRGSFITPGQEHAPRMQSPAGQPGQRGYPPQPQWQARASPAGTHATLTGGHAQQAQAQTPGIPFEDEVELQKKIMREARELARKRRLEQEEKEEAERQQRIAVKLASLGPPPETKRSKKEEEKPAPTQIQTRESTESAFIKAKPPVTQAGEVKQYGVMKVHAPETVRPLASATEQGFNKQEQPQLRDDTRPNGPSSSATGQGGRENSQEPEQSLHNSQPSSPGRYSNWNQNQGRLWGPPTNDRTLGNGTFSQDLSMSAVQGPGPIGPPLNNRGNGQYAPRQREPYGQRPAPIGPPSRQQEQRPVTGGAPSGWTGDVSARIAEDEARRRADADRDTSSRAAPPPTVFKDTWRPVQLGPDGRRIVGDALQKDFAGPVSTAQQQQQTWVDIPARPRQEDTPPFAAVEHGVNAQQPWAQGNIHDASSAIMATPSRGSRFFPQGREIPREMPPPDQDYGRRPGSPTPPPPTMEGHPAYDGDRARPHVSLPPPTPTVKLPPPAKVLAPIAPPKPISFAAAAAAAAAIPSGPRVPVAVPTVPSAAKSQAQTPGGGWQDKINSLMGRRGSPPKTHAMAVNSSSKHALDHSISHIPAISFPGFTNIGSDNGDYETKPMAEECFEEQEMGFVPVVNVPRDVPSNAYDLCPAPKPLPRKAALMLEADSGREVEFRSQLTKDGEIIRIHFPCMESEEPLTVVHKVDYRQRSNGNRRGRGGRGSSSSYTRGGRGRGGDGPSNYPGASPNEGGSPAGPSSGSQRGGRGRGAYGSSWNQRSTPPSAVNANA